MTIIAILYFLLQQDVVYLIEAPKNTCEAYFRQNSSLRVLYPGEEYNPPMDVPYRFANKREIEDREAWKKACKKAEKQLSKKEKEAVRKEVIDKAIEQWEKEYLKPTN